MASKIQKAHCGDIKHLRNIASWTMIHS